MTANIDRDAIKGLEVLVRLALARAAGGGGGGGGGGGTKTQASFVQPAVGATVNVFVQSSAGFVVGEGAIASNGAGGYAVSAVPDATHVTLRNVGSYAGVTNAAATTVIPINTILSPGFAAVALQTGDLTYNVALGYQVTPVIQSLGLGGAGGNLPIFYSGLQVDAGQPAPFLGQAPTTNATGQNMVVSAQASTNANGTPGNVVMGLDAPTGSGQFPKWQVLQGTSIMGQIAVGQGTNTIVYLHLLNPASGLTPDASNFVLGEQNAVTQFNAVQGTVWTMFNGNLSHNTRVETADGTQFFSPGVTPDFGGGSGVWGIGTANTAPTTNPGAGHFIVYVNPGNGHWEARGSGGTITTLALP